MKHLLAEGKLSTMHRMRLKVYRIVAIVLFMTGMALPLFVTNIAVAQMYENRDACHQEMANQCLAHVQPGYAYGFGWDGESSFNCTVCSFYDAFHTVFPNTVNQCCRLIYESSAANKVAEPQSE